MYDIIYIGLQASLCDLTMWLPSIICIDKHIVVCKHMYIHVDVICMCACIDAQVSVGKCI